MSSSLFWRTRTMLPSGRLQMRWQGISLASEDYAAQVLQRTMIPNALEGGPAAVSTPALPELKSAKP
jgi:hypothetical protein